MTTYIIGDLRTGRRIQTVPALAGPWDDVLNDAGTVSCTVSLRDPDVQRLGLKESAKPGKAFLAAVDGDLVLQAGPIWLHSYDADLGRLTLSAAGMWSYFDQRRILPVLAGRSPTDPTTDTRFAPASIDPAGPWPTDTRTSLQGIARALVAQAQAWTGGNVPVILPASIAGTSERVYRGVDLSTVGQALRDLTAVEGGPDVRFEPRLTTDRLGVEWVMRIGTPTQPLLFSAVEPTFTIGAPKSPVSSFKTTVSGRGVATHVYAAAGRGANEAIVGEGVNQALLDAGYPVLELVDSSRSTVSEQATIDAFAEELRLRSASQTETWEFAHETSERPFLSGYTVGDFALVRVVDDLYHGPIDPPKRMRIVARSGDAEGRKVTVKFQPEVV
ncbi:hypothetical protein [Microcella frigidaquae]|uniref:Phage protein D n=1 Tax=Microcella frigidaquae TaxID=424758 RepID=A0A840XK15_9MICO|nr:hypothetical protein [Microcella frigidaquae]MBB5617197.1 hypothetical protein [Microcella frigidaquae]NHN45102.1 hypothetical protein [Microcella frigidaquae]